MYVVVGLGNPGNEYAHTRHNVGFDVIELLAARLNAPLTKLKCKAKYGEAKIGGEKIILAQPQTYMNASGESVVQLVNWFKPEYDQLVVCCDDVDLPLGRIRMRAKGSAGTHNGLKSIIYLLGRDDFPRIRVGVGAPPPGWDLANYVLGHYETPEARKLAFDAYNAAGDAVINLVTRGLTHAVQQASLYGKPPKPEKPPKPPEENDHA